MARVHSETSTVVAEIEGDSLSKNTLYKRDILSIKDLSLDDIERVLSVAKQIKCGAYVPNLHNKIVASCFFESSTRTRLSFEAAVYKSHGNVIGFANDAALSINKGESLQDTIRVISDYADMLVIRHPKEGAARLAADIASVPVVNAGDGANQHPTQTLIDLFSIQESQGKLSELAIAMVGDLKYGRTVHSLAQACAYYNIRLYLVAPDSLGLTDTTCDYLKRKSVRFSLHKSIDEIIDKVDILYMTRVQKERINDIAELTSMSPFRLTTNLLAKAKPTMKILHPLPRVDEIEPCVDATPFAYYFQQSANGVFVRQAILSLILNEELS